MAPQRAEVYCRFCPTERPGQAAKLAVRGKTAASIYPPYCASCKTVALGQKERRQPPPARQGGDNDSEDEDEEDEVDRPTGRRQRALQVVPAAANGTCLPQHHHKPRQRQHQHPLVLTPRGGQKLGTRSQRGSSARHAWARSNLKSTSTRERLRMRLPLPLHSPAWPPQQIWPIWLQPRPRPRPRPPPGPSPHLCSTR